MKIINNIEYVELLDSWLHSKRHLKIQSFQKYERLITNYLKEYFKDIKVKKIELNNIINFFDDLEKRDVSVSVQKSLLYIIKSSLEYGEKLNLCKNLDLDIIKFKRYVPKITVLTKEEQLKIENYLKKNTNIRKVCILLCLYTGLRIGEVCGLKWSDIDLENNNITVNRTIQRIKNNSGESKTKLIASTPKSESSNRIIPIPEFITVLLTRFKSNQDYYILSGNQKCYDPRQFEYFYSRVLDNCGIKYVKFHTLRHTFATRAIESRMDIKTLSEILGHSSVDITLRIYVHSSFELKKKSIENLVEFMSN